MKPERLEKEKDGKVMDSWVDRRTRVKKQHEDHNHVDKFYYCPICMQYQYPTTG